MAPPATFSVEEGPSLEITSRTDIDAESIRYLIKNPDDEVLWEHSHDGIGTHEVQTSVEANGTGRNEMRVMATTSKETSSFAGK